MTCPRANSNLPGSRPTQSSPSLPPYVFLLGHIELVFQSEVKVQLGNDEAVSELRNANQRPVL